MIRPFHATLCLVLALPGLARAEGEAEACADRAAIVDQLKGKYQEAHRATGLQNDTRLIEIWTSPGGGSWTILVTDVNGTSCIAAAGRAWLDVDGPQVPTPTGTAS